jgi:hypothetical protein
VARYAGRGQTTNGFEFLWHEIFQNGVTHLSGEGVSDPSPHPVSDVTPKESQTEESQSEETNGDLDYPPTNRKSTIRGRTPRRRRLNASNTRSCARCLLCTCRVQTTRRSTRVTGRLWM